MNWLILNPKIFKDIFWRTSQNVPGCFSWVADGNRCCHRLIKRGEAIAEEHEAAGEKNLQMFLKDEAVNIQRVAGKHEAQGFERDRSRRPA